MLDTKEDARTEVYKTIRNNTKKEFENIVGRLKDWAKTESQTKRIEEAAEYIKTIGQLRKKDFGEEMEYVPVVQKDM